VQANLLEMVAAATDAGAAAGDVSQVVEAMLRSGRARMAGLPVRVEEPAESARPDAPPQPETVVLLAS
jgi:hypothetical protein